MEHITKRPRPISDAIRAACDRVRDPNVTLEQASDAYFAALVEIDMGRDALVRAHQERLAQQPEKAARLFPKAERLPSGVVGEG